MENANQKNKAGKSQEKKRKGTGCFRFLKRMFRGGLTKREGGREPQGNLGRGHSWQREQECQDAEGVCLGCPRNTGGQSSRSGVSTDGRAVYCSSLQTI